MEYRRAEEAARIGAEIIAEHHGHLMGLRVDFVFLDKKPKSKGKELWGRAKKISGLPAFLAASNDPDHYGFAEDFFVVEISEEAWDSLSAAGKRALIDHELSHMEIVTDDETGASKLAIVGHDVTEFEAVLRRHGAWNDTLESFVEVGAEQLSLEDAGPGRGAAQSGDPDDDEASDSEVQATITVRDRTFEFTDDMVERIAEGGRELRKVRG